MPVKTFVVGMANGLRDSMTCLDNDVNQLSGIRIISITDTLYPQEQLPSDNGPKIARVVIYEGRTGSTSDAQ